LEASASGLPVISTCHEGIQDVIIHGETGLLVNEHDVEGMAKHMQFLAEDFSRAKTLGTKGKQRIQDYFTSQKQLMKLDELIERAIKS
jgi:glycosyltransferase involved in cell wall biosynthesis